MAQEIEGDEPRAGLTTLSRALAPSLEKLADLRASLPPEARNPLPMGDLAAYEPPPARPTITKAELARHLLSLDVIFPSQHLDTAQMTLRFQIFYDDLRHLTELDLAAACERYRKSPENRFFPTPGQLLALAR